MSKVVIKSCDCQHEFQDKTYGKGQRVHNVSGTGSGGKTKCTVCGKVKS